MKKQIKINIEGKEFTAEARTFKTGKQGYGLYGTMAIDGEVFRINLNMFKL